MAAKQTGAVDKAPKEIEIPKLDHSKFYDIEALPGAKHLVPGEIYKGVPGGDAEGIIGKGHAKIVDGQ